MEIFFGNFLAASSVALMRASFVLLLVLYLFMHSVMVDGGGRYDGGDTGGS